jgi:spore coat protein H
MKITTKNIKHLIIILLFSTSIVSLNSCSDDNNDITKIIEEESEEENDDTDFVASDWTTETHTKDTDPNFDEIFDDNAVKRLDIVVTEERWESMLEDMTDH